MTYPREATPPTLSLLRSSTHRRYLAAATLVLCLAAAFRMIALQEVPPGLAQDEVLNADIVTFILQGRHALFFREGYGHEPLFHYWSVPFRVLLGDNVLSIRLPAMFIGLLLVAATMRWARRDFGALASVTAGLGLAVSWWPIIFSRVGLRPILEPLLLVGAAHFWSRRPWVSGLLLGLSFYSYTAARVVLLIPILMIGHSAFQIIRQAKPDQGERAAAAHLKSNITVLVVAAVVYLPLGLTLRADRTLQQRVDQLDDVVNALSEGEIRPLLESSLATMGVFSFTGDPRWTYTLPAVPIFDPVTALIFYAGVLVVLSRLRRPRFFLVAVWLAAALLPSAITPQAPSTVRMVGAIPVVFLLIGIAPAWLWDRFLLDRTANKPWPTTTPFLSLAAIVLLGLNVTRTIRDGFVRWPAEPNTRLKYQSILQEIGHYWQSAPDGPLVIATDFYRPITADSFWRNLGYDPQARWVQTGADVAGAVVFPTLAIGDGDKLFFVPDYAAPNERLLAKAGIPLRPIWSSQGKPSFAVYDLPSRPVDPAVPLNESFEAVITLLGYELEPVRTGSPLELFTYWRVDSLLSPDLAIFVHLLAESGEIAAQHDGLDAAAASLQPGDSFVQRHVLPWPDVVQKAEYTLQLGLYRRDDSVRLTRDGEPSDRVILTNRLILAEG